MEVIEPLPQPALPRLLDRVRDSVRRRHYSRRTEEQYVHWIKRFIYFNGKRHPAVSTTMVYTHVLEVAGGALRSPLDALQAP